jgi:hypothetical protein
LKQEFKLGKEKTYEFESSNSRLICLHVVQAIDSLGWGARSVLPQIQLLRGQDAMLDAAIDKAVADMQKASK